MEADVSHIHLSVEAMQTVAYTHSMKSRPNGGRLHWGDTVCGLTEGKRISRLRNTNKHKSGIVKVFSFSTTSFNYHNIGNVYCQNNVKKTKIPPLTDGRLSFV